MFVYCVCKRVHICECACLRGAMFNAYTPSGRLQTLHQSPEHWRVCVLLPWMHTVKHVYCMSEYVFAGNTHAALLGTLQVLRVCIGAIFI